MINYKYFIFFIVFSITLFANTQTEIYFNEYKKKGELLDNLTQKDDYKIVMLGDSLSAVGDWKNLLDRDDVLNLGVASDVTEAKIGKADYGLINRIDNLDKRFEKIFIMIGVNDFLFKREIPEVFSKYVKIIEKIEKNGIKPIVQSTLFIRENRYGFDSQDINQKIDQLDILLRKYCEKNNLIFINLNKYLSKENTLIEKYTWDGIHLNETGYKIWAKIVKKRL